MKTRSTLTTLTVAVLLALGLVVPNLAFGVTVIQPTVSLNAKAVGFPGPGGGIFAKGRYDNESRKCKGPGGRPVSLSVSDGTTASTTTRGSGNYQVKMGPFDPGRYTVTVTVPGEVRGGYGGTVVCNDATDSDDVKVKGKGGGDDDDDGDDDNNGGGGGNDDNDNTGGGDDDDKQGCGSNN